MHTSPQISLNRHIIPSLIPKYLVPSNTPSAFVVLSHGQRWTIKFAMNTFLERHYLLLQSNLHRIKHELFLSQCTQAAPNYTRDLKPAVDMCQVQVNHYTILKPALWAVLLIYNIYTAKNMHWLLEKGIPIGRALREGEGNEKKIIYLCNSHTQVTWKQRKK